MLPDYKISIRGTSITLSDLLTSFIDSYYSIDSMQYFPNNWDGISEIDSEYKPYANKIDFQKYRQLSKLNTPAFKLDYKSGNDE
jgi:hypothetical protein